MIAATVVCGIGIKKSVLEHMCIDYCSFCVWGQIAAKSSKNTKKIRFQSILEGFQLKSHIFYTKADHFMNNFGEIVVPSLSYIIKRAMICNLFVANPLDS